MNWIAPTGTGNVWRQQGGAILRRLPEGYDSHDACGSPSGCGAITDFATAGSVGTSQRKSAVAAPAPRICATMKAGASAGRMPANVSVAARASVTAGFAKD